MKTVVTATPSPMMHLTAIFTTIGNLQKLIDTFIPKNLSRRDRGPVDQLRERLNIDREKVRAAIQELQKLRPRQHHLQLQKAWDVLEEELLSGRPDELRLPSKINSAYNMTHKAERAMAQYFEELDAMRMHVDALAVLVGKRHAKAITFVAIDMIASEGVRRASQHTYERALQLMRDRIQSAGGMMAHSERVGGTDEVKAIFYRPHHALEAVLAIQREATRLLRYEVRGKKQPVGYRVGMHWASGIIELNGFCPGVTPEWTTTFRIRDLCRGTCDRGVIYLSDALRKHIRSVSNYRFYEHVGPFGTKRGEQPIAAVWELLWARTSPLRPKRQALLQLRRRVA